MSYVGNRYVEVKANIKCRYCKYYCKMIDKYPHRPNKISIFFRRVQDRKKDYLKKNTS